MNRYTDVDALMEECYKELEDDSLWHDEDTTKDYAEGSDDGKRIIMNIIDSAPIIDIEPKRGEWIEFDTKWGRSLYYCTNCKETSEVPTAFGKPLYNFCPNCGADMRKGADDEH